MTTACCVMYYAIMLSSRYMHQGPQRPHHLACGRPISLILHIHCDNTGFVLQNVVLLYSIHGS